MILKSSEKSPLGTLAIAALMEEAGLPAGVFQVVIGGGDVGAMLSKHMDINKISFTGSTATGRKIQETATKSNLKRVTLELGGKSPAIIFKDADIGKAVFWSMLGITVRPGEYRSLIPTTNKLPGQYRPSLCSNITALCGKGYCRSSFRSAEKLV